MARQLKAEWTAQSREEFLRDHLPDIGCEFDYVRPVRWWQFWRWHQAFTNDYLCSRFAEHILASRMTRSISEQIAKDILEGLYSPEILRRYAECEINQDYLAPETIEPKDDKEQHRGQEEEEAGEEESGEEDRS